MPFDLELPEALRRQGWKVKIRQRERLEPPHAAVIRGRRAWRFGLREGFCLDRDPPARELPGEILSLLDRHMEALSAAWDGMYPENPVGSTRDGQANNEA